MSSSIILGTTALAGFLVVVMGALILLYTKRIRQLKIHKANLLRANELLRKAEYHANMGEYQKARNYFAQAEEWDTTKEEA